MRLDALLEMGAAERLAAERDEADLQRVVDQLRADGLAAENKRFREWLGELVEDLEIDGPEYKSHPGRTGEFVSWEIRPRSWLVDWVISVHHDGEGYIFKHDYFIKSVDDPKLAKLFVKWQEEHDKEVKLLVAKWAKELATPRDPGCIENEARLWNAREQLGYYAPERLDEWDALLAKSLEELEAWRSEEAEKVALRVAAVERYEEALEVWVAECDAARTHNADVAVRLRKRLGQPGLSVREIEYAVVADDGESGRMIETHRVWATAINPDSGWARVIENDQVRQWTFANVIRFGEWEWKGPTDPPFLLPSVDIGDERVYYVPGHGPHLAAVKWALAEALDLPEEPDWGEFGSGLYWGTDVDAAVRRATHDHAADEDDIAF